MLLKLTKNIDKVKKIFHDEYIITAQIILFGHSKKEVIIHASKESKEESRKKDNSKAKNKEKEIVSKF